MGGRLFSVLILGAIVLLFRNFPKEPNPQVILITGSLIVLGIISPFSPIWNYAWERENTNLSDLVDTFMIADERGFYFQDLGLINSRKYSEWPDCSVRINRLRTNLKYKSEASTIIQIGLAGFCAGPSVRIIDQMGLADPLLSRLPPRFSPYWRPGHLGRIIPDGYKETVQTGENKLKDPNLANFYNQIKAITQDEIWSVPRFKTIISMNLGRYNNLINQRYYRHPTLIYLGEGEEREIISEGTPLDDPRLIVLYRDGILIDLGEISNSESISLGIDQLNVYQIRFLKGNEEIGRINLHRSIFPNSGLAIINFTVPRKVSRSGFDQVWILPMQNSRGFSFDQPFTLNSQDHPEIDSSRFSFLELK